MEIGNMKNILLLMGVAVAGAFWACGDGSIVTKSGDDEMALLNYGEFNPEGMKSLVNGALAACNEDPACVAAMEAAAKAEESSSSADSTTADSLASSSSGAGSSGSGPQSSGAISGSSGAGGSSSGTAGSSGSVGSSSSAMLVSSSSLTPATNVAGFCTAAVNPFTGLGKNTPTTWSFTNTTTATAETYDWTFDEGASIAISTDATPSVSYSTAGTHVAKVIVNKGKSSESIETTCTSIVVTGTRASGCECTTTTTSPIDVTADNPQNVTWTVSGCSTSDGSELTYTWEEGVTANGTSATKSISTGGTHAPKVTVTAESDTVVTCQAVTATAPATAHCYLASNHYDHYQQHSTNSYSTAPGGSFYFGPVDVEGIAGATSMTVTVNGSPTTITVKEGNGSDATKLTAPSQEGTYPVTLSHNGRDVCSATLTVAYPKITSTSCTLNNNKFSPGSSFNGWVGDDNLSMDFYRDDTKLTSFTVNRYYNGEKYTVTMPSAAGTYNFRLVYQGNEVCKIAKTVALNKPTCYVGATSSASSTSYTAIPGQGVYFKPGDSNIPSAKDMTLSFNGGTQSINVKPSSNSSTALQAPTAVGTYPITLSDNGNNMCSATLKVDYPKPACNIGATSSASSNSYTAIPGQPFYFKPGDYSFVGEIGMTYTFNGSTEDLTLLPSNNAAIPLTAPTEFGSYDVVLKYGNNQVCKATLTVDYPKPACNIGATSSPSSESYTAIPGQTVYFKPGNSGFVGEMGMTYTFNGSTEDYTLLPSNNEAIPLTAPAALGSYDVVLKYGNSQACKGTLTVDYPKPSCNIGKNASSATSSSYTALGGRSFVFKPGNSSFVGTIGMDLTFNGNTQSITVKPSDNTATSLTAPNTSGNLPVTLKYGTNQVCSATLTVLTDADFDEVTAAGTYSGSKKIKFVNSKTCQISASASTWNTWVMEGTISSNWGTGGQINGTMYMNIPSGSSFTISNCW